MQRQFIIFFPKPAPFSYISDLNTRDVWMLPGMIYCARVNREVSTEFFIFSELRGKILYVYVYLGRLL